MADTILVEQEIEPGQTERAKALFKEVGQMKQSDAVIEALQKEGVYTETAFLQRTENGDFVLYYIEAEDGEQVYDVYQDIMADPEGKTEGLEEFIREFDAVMAGEPQLADVDCLYHLTTPGRP